ncbi:MAG: Gp138 family membrane-puncturing spike protein [Rhodopila sp.]|nr:Gp138 family membrane-puncturing spike protein [Rhodopila sp.]
MSGQLSTSGGYAGPAWLQTPGTHFQGLDFVVRQILAGKAFLMLAKVMSVTGGGVGTPAIVSVQPTVNQVDGLGNQTAHGTIYNIPCFRYQGGSTAVIVDPVVGETGLLAVCQRDISAVKANGGAISPPGSARQHDWSDGIYLGSVLGDTPTTYVQVTGNDIHLHAGGHIYLEGNVVHTGTFISNGKNIGSTHEHGGVQTGSGNTGQPI